MFQHMGRPVGSRIQRFKTEGKEVFFIVVKKMKHFHARFFMPVPKPLRFIFGAFFALYKLPGVTRRHRRPCLL